MVILSVGALNASSMVKVFALQDYEYANVTTKKIQKYNIDNNLILSMKVFKVETLDGYEGYTEKDTFIKGVFIKPTLKNWVLTMDINANLYAYRDWPRILKITDENGLALSMNINHGKLCAGDMCTEADSDAKNVRITVKVIYANNKVTFYVGNNKLYSSKKRFSKLKSFEYDFHHNNNNTKIDTLVDIVISEIK